MAFLSKIGNIIRQTANKHIGAESSGSRPSIYQAIRCMSSSKLFVGGISYQTDDTSLREAFSKYGEVVESRIIMDRESGRSRGFGFVTYTSSEEASSAIQALDGQDLHGRQIRVNYANDRARSSFGGGGDYSSGYGAGGGGGYNSGYGAGGGGGYNSGYGAGGGGGYNSGYGVGGGSGYGPGGGSGYNTGYGPGGGDSGYNSNYGGPDGYNGGGNVSHAGGNTFDSASAGAYSNATGYGVTGGGSGNDNYGSTTGGGSDGNDGLGFAGGQGGFSGANSMDSAAEGYNQGDALESNYRDDDDDTSDFAKRA